MSTLRQKGAQRCNKSRPCFPDVISLHCRPEDKSIHLIKNKKNMIYKVIKKKNPKNVEEPGKYYGCLVSTSLISIDEIATRISATCTVTRHDCLAVLSALQEQIILCPSGGQTRRPRRHRLLPHCHQRKRKRHGGGLQHKLLQEYESALHSQQGAEECLVAEE